MKIVLQGFEPQPAPVNATGIVSAKFPMRRKPRVQLHPVVAETRLFHAL